MDKTLKQVLNDNNFALKENKNNGRFAIYEVTRIIPHTSYKFFAVIGVHKSWTKFFWIMVPSVKGVSKFAGLCKGYSSLARKISKLYNKRVAVIDSKVKQIGVGLLLKKRKI